MKIFVTGATSFVGKVFTENLLSKPCKVEACVRQSSVALPLTVEYLVMSNLTLRDSSGSFREAFKSSRRYFRG